MATEKRLQLAAFPETEFGPTVTGRVPGKKTGNRTHNLGLSNFLDLTTKPQAIATNIHIGSHCG